MNLKEEIKEITFTPEEERKIIEEIENLRKERKTIADLIKELENINYLRLTLRRLDTYGTIRKNIKRI